VAHQLSKYIRIKGAGAPFTKEQLVGELRQASLELYEDDEEQIELLDCQGFTAAAIRKVCEAYGIPFHVKHGAHKVEAFTPPTSKFEQLAVVIWGDHLYTVADAAARQAIVRETPATPDDHPWVLAPIQRADRKAPGLSEWELYTQLQPGHFYS
jgi:hypothetical protein